MPLLNYKQFLPEHTWHNLVGIGWGWVPEHMFSCPGALKPDARCWSE